MFRLIRANTQLAAWASFESEALPHHVRLYRMANHDLIRHLEMCIECQHELAARRELRSRLRNAFEQAAELRMREEFGVDLKQKLWSQLRNR